MIVSRKGIPRHVKLTKTVLKPSRKGANARGICSHKRTRGARVTTPSEMLQTGYAPTDLSAYVMTLAKVKGHVR